jgi:hypothetical protein
MTGKAMQQPTEFNNTLSKDEILLDKETQKGIKT